MGAMKKAKARRPRAHPFAYEGLDRVIHERARLGVLTSLLAHPGGLSFAAMKQLCGLTDGNLSRHLDVLESARLVDIRRATGDGRPQSLCRITAEGRRRFITYLSVLERVLLDAGAKADAETRPARDLLRLASR
jgi:predicted ArsR family transcriptional regulator